MSSVKLEQYSSNTQFEYETTGIVSNEQVYTHDFDVIGTVSSHYIFRGVTSDSFLEYCHKTQNRIDNRFVYLNENNKAPCGGGKFSPRCVPF